MSGVIFRAPWVVPVSSAVIGDGAVLVQNGRICGVDRWTEIRRHNQDLPVREIRTVIMPGLVNAHMHLELSLFGPVSGNDGTMCDWIRNLLLVREESAATTADINMAAVRMAERQYDSGVVLLLDTCNTPLSGLSGAKNIPVVMSLLEMLGPSRDLCRQAIERLRAIPDNASVTGHAPYSTAPGLLQEIKRRSLERGDIFSLHVAENIDEELLLLHGTGCFDTFLQERGLRDDTFPLVDPAASVIVYLDSLGLLDSSTILVHCVHVRPDETKIIREKGCHICLCPGSNRFLGAGTAPLEQFLEYGIIPALGTDSIASNPEPDMWSEMALLRRLHQDVSPEMVLAMATIGGARALQKEKEFGTLGVGCAADFIVVDDSRLERAADADELLDLLTSMKLPASIVHVTA